MSKPNDFTELAEEHSILIARVDELLTCTDAELMALVQSLAEMLDSHFASEEAPRGFLALIGGDANPHVSRILDEHQQIRTQVDELLALAVVQTDEDVVLREELRHGAKRLVGMLRGHEALEYKLLVEWVGDNVYPGINDSDDAEGWHTSK